ncbi:MAG TPA: PilN domain-containing protein, partial [Dongiaceae bacterium]|jgi:Tfp pilus assembly protein PilN
MIRINLLTSERKTAKAASKGFQAGQKMMILGSLIFVLAVAALGWRYWALGQQAAQLDAQIENARREEQRLQEILREVKEFEARKTVLQARLDLIDALRKGQNAPVHMVDQVSRSLPDMTWLTNMIQQPDGYTLQIQGRCLTLTSLSDFIGNLEGSRYFIRPVEIVESTVVPGDGKTTPDLIQFTIRGTFQMAGIESVAPPPPTAAKRR